MSTVIFFNIPAHGHTNPTLPLVQELVRRGERVIYYNTETFRAKAESTGAIFRSYGENHDFEPGQDSAAAFRAMAMILAAGETIIPAILDHVRAEKPEYIIYDSMCPWGKQIAQLLDLPAICSCSIIFIGSKNYRALPRVLASPAEVISILPMLMRLLVRYRQIAARIQRKYGVPSPAGLDIFGNPGDITLVYTSRYFQIGAELLDDTFKFVGPSIASRQDHSDFPFEWLEGAPVIYISLGTIFNDRPDFFRACIQAFGNTPYRVVMSLGRVKPESLGAIPDNFLVRPYVPQLALLQKTALFITHGGMNSVSESAWFGVPMLVAPQAGDQLIIARRVMQLGAGLMLDSRRLSAQTLRQAAEKVLGDESFRKQCQVIGDSFREAGGYVRAADQIFAFKERMNRAQTK